MKLSKYFAKIKEFLESAYKKNKKLFFVTIALVFIVVASAWYVFANKSTTSKTTKISSSGVSVDSYASSVEQKLESKLLNMKNVSSVEVFVMIESTPIKNYLTEQEVVEITNSAGTTTTTTTTVVYEKDGSATSPIEVSTQLPKITGVLIFLNKIDASTKLSITNAVACVLNVESSCISILQDS